ncbi:hypothetical protein FQN55_001507 [Onygenales sp. PD_40]|nr:hypothetical protein FQN55_001507 [Onygenales sp. PD_40]
MKKWKSRLVRRDSSSLGSNSQITPTPSITTPTSSTNLTEDEEAGSVAEKDQRRRSDILKFNPSLTVAAKKSTRRRSIDRRKDPLGLSLIYSPDSGEPTADIIFVHGLGGTSRMTWSYNRDEELFWPEVWLPTEPDICTARILSYGYNAHFASQGPNSIAGISDFAKQLLFDMKFGKDSFGEDLGVGQRPIIFVVHSMGGLVFKKAVVQGQNDDKYKDPISQVKAVLFLSTPHRGTNLAETLNRILAVSIFNHTPKQYVSELRENSPFIEDVNEEFRKHASRMQIFSFYETLETTVGPKRFKLMVLQRSSSTLGYPDEITEPLNADHHSVCKFPNRQDPSYRSIRAVLKTLVSTHRQAKDLLQQARITADNEKILSLLGTFPSPNDDYTSLLQQWRPGTCQNLFSNERVQDWEDAPTGSKILWIYSKPGSGKSVQSAVYIQHIKEKGFRCAYYFFRYGDSRKRSPKSLLQSILYQIAQEFPAFRGALAGLKDRGMTVAQMSAAMIWDKLFVAVLFNLQFTGPVYVIIDALDESDSINMIANFLGSIDASSTPLRFLVTSRKTPDITTAFDRISLKASVIRLPFSNNLEDIKLYAESEMEYMHGDVSFRKGVLKAIIGRAEGNFLWVSLAIREILQCHSPEDISQVLLDMPAGMEPMYARMEASITQLTKPSDIIIAKNILSWATYCRRPLKVHELVRALNNDMPVIIDVRHTISQLCGHFVVIDSNDSLILVHKTAREYLLKAKGLPFEFGSEYMHEAHFQQSLTILLEQETRQKLSLNEKPCEKDLPPFVLYAATSWAYHLSRSSPASDTSLTLLVRFLKSTSVLLWIRVLASLRQLKVLIPASGALRKFVSARRKLDSSIQPLQHRITDLEVTEHWATDLLKIVGKFSGYLSDEPAAIQRLVPQFCPQGSAIHQQFSKQSQLSVKNISNHDWDDCVGRVSLGTSHQGMKIICSDRHLAAVTTAGKIFLWDSTTFEKACHINHDEFIFAMCFDSSGEFLASYGYITTKIWNVPSGRVVYSIPNIPMSRALAITFSQDDRKLIVGLDTRKVAVAEYQESLQWEVINSGFLQEVEAGSYLNAPMTVAFTADATFVAVGYRGSAMEVWDMVEEKRVSKCKRRHEYDAGPLGNWTGVLKAAWHPSGQALLGIYTDGTVFKWNPFEEFDHQELAADRYSGPSEIRCSPDGTLFLLGDQDGSVRIYNYENFSLIYKLSSEDAISDLCFSMDSRRFYDLRGPYCNIWEPNALLRLSDFDDDGNETDTRASSMAISTHASESHTNVPTRITALATRQRDGIFCYGNEDGLVEIDNLSVLKAKSVGKTKGEGPVEFIVWSDDGNYMAYAEADSVTVKKLTFDQGNMIKTFELVLHLDLDLEGGKVHQILLHPRAAFLFIADAESITTFNLATKCRSAKVGSDGNQRWTNHPFIENQLLAFDVDIVTSYSWESLEVITKWDIKGVDIGNKQTPLSNAGTNPGASQSGMHIQDYVDEVIVAATRNYATVSLSQDGSSINRWTSIRILDLSGIHDPDRGNIIPISIPEAVRKAIGRPLGIIAKNRLIFVDLNFWICSWVIGSEQEEAKRHFFLPKDWVSPEMLGMCAVVGEGVVLVPQKGGVAVIRSSLCGLGGRQ